MRRGSLRIACAALALGLAPAAQLLAQQTDPKLWEEIQSLKRGQEEIRRQLLEIRQLIQARLAPAPAALDVRNALVDLGSHLTEGSSNAALTLIEFSDYQCPYCGRHARETVPLLKKEYVEKGKVRYVFFDMPLESIHPLAFKSAEASRCAGEQGKYWEMHDRLFANQQALEPWSAHAKALGLDVAAFEACMSGNRYATAVRADMVTAQSLGINGTPAFLVALTDPTNPTKVKGLTLMRGAQAFGSFKLELDRALAPEAAEK
jgi:protein-disulfide isomerase